MTSVLMSLMHWSLMRGGGETYATKLAHGLLSRGNEVSIITGKPLLSNKLNPPSQDIDAIYIPHIYLRKQATTLMNEKTLIMNKTGRVLSAITSISYAWLK